MQKWQYYALQVRGNDLFHYKFEKGALDIQAVQIITFSEEWQQAGTATKVRSWAANLGEKGWELVSITIYSEEIQEWIFKRPLQDMPTL